MTVVSPSLPSGVTLGQPSGATATPSLPTVGSLRRLTAVGVTAAVVFVTGYAQPGDGGEGFFWLNAADTTTVDDGGTIVTDASNNRWYRFTNGTALNLLWFCGNTVTDYASPLANALAVGAKRKRGATVILPAGLITLNSAVTFTYPTGPFSLKLAGESADASFVYSPASNGLALAGSDVQHVCHLRDFTMATGASGTYTALTLTQSVPQGLATQNDITGVTFLGFDTEALTKYWTRCINVVGWNNVNFNGLMLYGGPNGSTSSLGDGIAVAGNLAATAPNQYGLVYNLDGCSFWELNNCFIYGTYVQGVAMVNCNFTNSSQGVYNPPGAINGAQLSLVNCQFACFGNAILIAGTVNNVFIGSGTVIYITVSNSTGVGLAVGGSISFINMNGAQIGVVGTPTSTNGVNLLGTVIGGNISGSNIFAGLTTAVNLGSGTSWIWVDQQAITFYACTNEVLNSGTNNQIITT